MVASYAPSTLAAYLSKWRHWLRFASACDANPYDPSIDLLLDFLATNSRGKLQTATTWIKSLRFISRKAQLDSLRSALRSDLVSAYGRSGSIVERRESAPLPLSFVIFLERRVLDTSLSSQQRIIAGAFLLCIFASLRFSDALWCPPGRLSITGECLLGVCLKTKTTRRAMPFGVSLQATAMLHPNFTPDFVLARHCTPSAALLYLLFTVTFLSYGRQLLIREDLQRQQGHHRSSLAGMSDLYGRDDVAGPLEFQRQVVGAVLEGFRPRRPRLRGGLPPTVDVEVALPCVPGASDMPPVGSNPVPPAEHDTSSESEVEDTRSASPIPLPPPTQELPESVTEALSMTMEPIPQDASSSSGAAEEWTDVQGHADEFFFLLNGVKVPRLKLSLRAGCSVRGVDVLLASRSLCPYGQPPPQIGYLSFEFEITIWEAAWGSIAFTLNHRVLLFSNQQIWLAPDEGFMGSLPKRICPETFHFLRGTLHSTCCGLAELHCPYRSLFLLFTHVQFHLALAWSLPSIMAAPPRHDDPAYFQKRCEDMSLPAGLLDTLVDKGFNSMALLAFAVPDSDSLEHFIVSIVGRPLGSDPSAPLLTADAAALRRLYHLCKTECAGVGPSAPASIVPAASGKKSLSKEEIAELMQKFMKAYPSELVRADIMPSSPFLMIVREHLDAGRFSWIPWRLCSSASDEEQFLERRRPRTDAKLLTRLLQEGQPEEECIASIPQSGPVEPIVRRFWDLLMYAIALNDGAHLLHLRKAAEKFLSIALATPSDRNMRPPSLQEIVEADRALWLGVASIQADQGWSLTDALAEMIFARPDVYSALAKAKATSKKDAAPKVLASRLLSDASDCMNACAPNIVLPLTSFTGGELHVSKVGAPTADHVPLATQFVDLPVASGPVSFNARDCPHEVLPSKGLRVVVAAYTLQAALHLDSHPALRASLTALAFPLPPVDFVYSPEDLAPRALPLSPSQRERALLPSPMAAVGSSAPSASASATAQPCDGRSLFLDLFAGARAPVTSAIQSLRCDCFPPVDLIIDASRDILDDAFFDLLCRIADSGLVGAALAAPVCSKHSILRLRPGGPKPLRDFEHPTGRPDLNWDDSTQLQESALLHDRTRLLLSRVSAAGGLIILENPASSLTFHDPLMMSWIESEAPFCAQAASCMVGASFSKSWMFVSNQPCILDLACICTHAPGTHASFVGKRDGAGFLSRRTAEYPDTLASSLARLCAPFLTDLGTCSDFSRWRALLPLDPDWIMHPCRVEDGGGATSTACWLRPPSDDVLHDLRHRWSHRLFDTGLCMRIAAHLQLAPKEPPLSDAEVAPFLQDIFNVFQVPPTSQEDLLFIAPGQPLRLRLLKFLLSQLQDSEVSLCDQLESGVSLGVGSALEPSQHWPVRDAEHVMPALHICEGAWQSAESHPDIVQALLEEELQEEWISEYASLDSIQSEFPQVAL
ncbi:unnamed protein product, partial [Symbiodinium necroappetens]